MVGWAGPIPFAFPNFESRVRAVRFHDLHHVVTGYTTDFVGEAQISAWEIASGCGRHGAAWLINLYALFLGLFFDTGAVHRAFVRGRHSENLYRREFDEALLAQRVGETRRALALDREEDWQETATDRLAFAGWAALATLQAMAGLAPLALLLGWLV